MSVVQRVHVERVGVVLDEVVGDGGRYQSGRCCLAARVGGGVLSSGQIVLQLDAVLVEQMRFEKVLVAHFFLANVAESLHYLRFVVAFCCCRLICGYGGLLLLLLFAQSGHN